MVLYLVHLNNCLSVGTFIHEGINLPYVWTCDRPWGYIREFLVLLELKIVILVL